MEKCKVTVKGSFYTNEKSYLNEILFQIFNTTSINFYLKDNCIQYENLILQSISSSFVVCCPKHGPTFNIPYNLLNDLFFFRLLYSIIVYTVHGVY